ncbi:Lrp/AsnC family transcriptional regulator [Celerinatantimonas yamalensis]|uniref:Lrp/AsnC family transcriptional regulator n=1 Tax=Celerinatantimonas yamalensis TaxID=559956 RepID=A0ABW9G8X3_9GAMM
MDKFDHHIVTLLADNARLPVSEIARTINLSRTATQQRIRQLELRGVLAGYHAKVLDPEHGEPLCVYFEVYCHDSDWTDYQSLVAKIPEIRMCHFISGQVDLMVYVQVARMSRLEAIRDELEHLPGVTLVRTHLVMKTLIDR